MGTLVVCFLLVLLAMVGTAIYVFVGSSQSDEPDWETASRQDIEAWSAARQARQLLLQHRMGNYISSRDATYDDKTFELRAEQLTKGTTDDCR